MAFILNAQLKIQAAKAIATVTSQLRKGLGSVRTQVRIDISRTVEQRVDRLNKKIISLDQNLKKATVSAAGFSTALTRAANTFNLVNARSNAFVTSTQKVTTSSNRAAKSLKQTAFSMGDLGDSAALATRRFVAFSLAAGALITVVVGVRRGITAAIEFQDQLVKLSQVTQSSVSSLSFLSDEVTRLSTTLGVSSASLLDVSRILIQAGLSAEDTTIALGALAKTELAPTFTDIKNTAEGAIALMSQFGLEAKDLEKAFGAINIVSANFAVEADNLISVIRRTGGVFRAASADIGTPLEQLNQLIAAFTSVRATTRESADSIATGLRTIFTRISRPDTITFLRQFQIELEEIDKLSGKTLFVGPVEAIRRVNAALAQLDPREATFRQIIEQVAGLRQISRAIPLLTGVAKAQNVFAVAQAGSTSLTDAAIRAQDSFLIRLTAVREEFFDLFRTIGQDRSIQLFLDTLLNLASAAIQLTKALTPLIPLLATIAGVKIAGALTQIIPRFGARLTGRQRGGTIPGSGSGDIVPALLEPGEFVINKRAAQRIGLSNLKRLNQVDKLAQGGIVRSFQSGGAIQRFQEGGTVTRRARDIIAEKEVIGFGKATKDNTRELGKNSKTLSGFADKALGAGLALSILTSTLVDAETRTGGAIQAGISGASVGLFIASINPVLGIIIGLGAAVLGATSALADFDKRQREVNINEAFERLDKGLADFLSGQTKIISEEAAKAFTDVSKLLNVELSGTRLGFSEIRKEAALTGKGVSTFDTFVLGAASSIDKLTSSLGLFDPGQFLRGLDKITGGQTEQVVNILNENKARQTQLLQLKRFEPALLQTTSRLLENADSFEDFLEAQRAVGGGLLKQLAEIRALEKGTNDAAAELEILKEEARKTSDAFRDAQAVADAFKAIRERIDTSLESLTNFAGALQGASLEATLLRDSAKSVSQAFEGQITAGGPSRLAEAISLPATAQTARQFEQAVTLITGPLGESGEEIKKFVLEQRDGVRKAREIIRQIAQTTPVQEFEAEIRKQLEGAEIGKNVREGILLQIETLAGGADASKVFDAFKTKFSDTFDKIENELVADFTAPLQTAAAVFDKELGEIGNALKRNRELLNKVASEQAKVAQFELNQLRSEAERRARQTGRPVSEFLTVAQQQAPFQAQLEQFTRPLGLAGDAAFDVSKIMAAAAQSTENLKNALVRSTQSFDESIARQEDIAKFSDEIGKAKNALEVLTKSSERTAAAQNRLAELQEQEQSRFDIFLRLAGASNEELARINQEAGQAIQIIQATGRGIQLGALPEQIRTGGVSFLRSLGTLRADILGGLTGTQFLTRRTAPLGFGNIPGAAFQPTAAEQREREALEGQVAQDLATATEAQKALVQLINQGRIEENKLFNKSVDTFKAGVDSFVQSEIVRRRNIAQVEEVVPANRARGGSIFQSRGTDTVPAMLTPGEFVVNRQSAQSNMDLLSLINNKKGPLFLQRGGIAIGGKPSRFQNALIRLFGKSGITPKDSLERSLIENLIRVAENIQAPTRENVQTVLGRSITDIPDRIAIFEKTIFDAVSGGRLFFGRGLSELSDSAINKIEDGSKIRRNTFGRALERINQQFVGDPSKSPRENFEESFPELARRLKLRESRRGILTARRPEIEARPSAIETKPISRTSENRIFQEKVRAASEQIKAEADSKRFVIKERFDPLVERIRAIKQKAIVRTGRQSEQTSILGFLEGKGPILKTGPIFRPKAGTSFVGGSLESGFILRLPNNRFVQLAPNTRVRIKKIRQPRFRGGVFSPTNPFAAFGFAAGGSVPGGGNTDSVPSLLTPGEFVLNSKAVRSLGRRRLQRFNQGGPVQHLQGGGDVGPGGSFQVNLSSDSIQEFGNVFGSNIDLLNNQLNTSFGNFINNFNDAINSFSAAAESFPQSISIEGNQTIEVIVNGVDSLRAVQGAIQEEILIKVQEELNALREELVEPGFGGERRP